MFWWRLRSGCNWKKKGVLCFEGCHMHNLILHTDPDQSMQGLEDQHPCRGSTRCAGWNCSNNPSRLVDSNWKSIGTTGHSSSINTLEASRRISTGFGHSKLAAEQWQIRCYRSIDSSPWIPRQEPLSQTFKACQCESTSVAPTIRTVESFYEFPLNSTSAQSDTKPP